MCVSFNMSPFVQDERTALHEACRSQSEAQGDLAKVTQLLIDAGSDVNSKASDAGEVSCYILLLLLLQAFIKRHISGTSTFIGAYTHYNKTYIIQKRSKNV